MELFGTNDTAKDTRALPSRQAGTPDDPEQESKRFTDATANARTFAELGLCDWLCKSTSFMGFKKPTDIQKSCIPAILQGRDVLACAETGSGKTAAFALPILQRLSEDPYGIYALILTPTRELAMQISEQVRAFGASFGVRVSLVIGGMNVIEQSLALSKRPHFVIATPGRMRHHLESAQPPDISRTQYLVLDEADRLISAGFASELEIILSKMNPRRKTLLFSATLTESLAELEKLAMSNALRFDLTSSRKMPTRLEQNYLFMSAKIKTCFLIAALHKLGLAPKVTTEIYNKGKDDGKKKRKKGAAADDEPAVEEALTSSMEAPATQPRSAIIFVGTCQRCQDVSEILAQMGVDCAPLHSLMNQTLRFASLNKFKSRTTRILIATDVASRGLDIPEVDLVLNYDLPKISSEYVHRVGRTARAGRKGRSLSFITQHDVDLLKSIEGFTGQEMTASTEVQETEILPLLNPVSKAMRLAQMKLLDSGFEDKVSTVKKRKRAQRKEVLRSVAAGNDAIAAGQSDEL
jgi:ATP-dependent RNA helicase DDX49/DBP8